jgi:hypothetical protein
MTRRQTSLAEIFETQIHTLALTLRPKTVETYRCGAHSFLSYLRVAFPRLRQLSQLRRDPVWFSGASTSGMPFISGQFCESHP